MIPQKLKDIKVKLEENKKPGRVTVRTLLRWYGSERRGWWVVKQIRSDLKKLKLITIPDFDSAYIDSLVEFRKVAAKSGNKEDESDSEKPNEPENIAEKSLNEVLNIENPTYLISRLEAANTTLIAVNPESELSEAITKMMHYDFSQLPVMQSKRDLKGVITWRSIGRKLCFGCKLTKVKDFMEDNYQAIPSNTSLFRAIPLIIEHDYVLVRNEINEYSGIITATDLTSQFKQLTEPFLLVGEIENHLRQIVAKLNKEDFIQAKDERDADRVIEKAADLSLGEYVRLFQQPSIWTKLNLTVHQKEFCKTLERIREIRNNIMHFDPDGLDEESIKTLNNFVRMLQSLRNLKVF